MTMFQTLRRMMASTAAPLKIECEGCGRRVAWDQPTAFARLGPDASPHDIRRRLVCGQCGNRQAVRLWI